MDPQDANAACIVCGDIITNPVCPECIEGSVKSWLGGVKPDLVSKFDGMHTYTEVENSTRCIFCKRDMVLCPHCTSASILEMLQEEHDAFLEDEFRTFFDFDLTEIPYSM